MEKAPNLLLSSLSRGEENDVSLQERKGGRDLLSFGPSRKVGRRIDTGVDFESAHKARF